ncbi:MAG: hypothetical protein JWR38_3577 [Mucilaginibacter sp.]|nr:hypothetical protein [Mucilaginibacter sp.]
MFKSLIIFLSILVFFNATASPSLKNTVLPVAHHQLKTDSTRLVPREFNKASLKAYKNNPDFNYHIQKKDITLWDRFWEWIWDVWNNFWLWVNSILEKLFGHRGGHSAFLVMKYLILGIGVCLIVYVVFKLLGIDLLHLFRKEPENKTVSYSESIENINEINFDEAIENALSIKNYRLAVRLLYLRCLKQLSDKHLINWRLEKTNTAYLNELTDNELRRQFTQLTRQFEYVWYGNFPVNGQSFQNINAIFQEFKRLLP